jgi:hypothetical protein
LKTFIGMTCLSVVLAGAAAARAQASAPAGIELGAVTILVKDEDAAAAWYARNLGLQVAMDVRDKEGERFIALKAPQGSSPLIVLHRPGSSKYPDLDRTLPRTRIGQETYWVWRTPDFAGTYKRLVENDVRRSSRTSTATCSSCNSPPGAEAGTVAGASALDAPGQQSLDVVALQHHEERQHREHGDDGAGHHQLAVLHMLP